MAVSPSISQEANKFILARMMYGEVPCAFIVLVFLLTNERSNSTEPSNMSRVWIPVRTRSKSFREDLSDMLGPFHPYIPMDGLRDKGNSCSPNEGGVHHPLGAPSFRLPQGASFDVLPLW
jgi:hypothetical protein